MPRTAKPSGSPCRNGLRRALLLATATIGATLVGPTHAATPADLLAGYVAAAGAPAQPARGQQFFTTRHGGEWACASCHTGRPTVDGQHAVTAKRIAPLAPAGDPQRFTDPAKVEKWFRRNCKDVVGRECSAAEKADVMAWLTGLAR